MRNLICILIGSLLTIFLPFMFSQEQYRSEYKIGPEDVLNINVVGDTELSRIYRVSENGYITLPYLGDVHVEGMTKSELETKLTELLDQKDILENPQVIILFEEYVSKKVSILGAVQLPGRYELPGRLTLSQIIAQAGGETNDAGEQIEIIRDNDDGTNSILRVSRNDLYTDVDFDIALKANDIVRVLKDESVWIYIGGRVVNPGRFELKESKLPTLLQAIILAGDFADRASEGSVILRRMDDQGKWNVTRYDVNDIIKGKLEDVKLQADDIIIVPKSAF